MKTDLSGLPVLSALLERSNLKFVDVGGRGSALKTLLTLARYAHYFVSEPDAEEALRLGEVLNADGRWRGVTVFSDAVASRRGDASLRITRHPGMSSLLEPDPEVTAPFFNHHKYDVERIETVRTVPLDDAAERHGFTDACFLKLDTQGTELDIMRSGERLMSGPVLGVYLEANFRPFYKEQSVFADLDSHLRSHGLSLFLMNRTGLRRTNYRADYYSKRVITWAHCLYLREPVMVVRRGEEAARRDLPRLLGLAMTFQLYDLAFEIVDAFETADVMPGPQRDELRKEVDYISRHVTKRVFRDAEKEAAEASADLVETLLSPTMRDKDRTDRS